MNKPPEPFISFPVPARKVDAKVIQSPAVLDRLADLKEKEDAKRASRELKDSGREPTRREKLAAVKDALVDSLYEDAKEGRAPTGIELQRVEKAVSAGVDDDSSEDDLGLFTDGELAVLILTEKIKERAQKRTSAPTPTEANWVSDLCAVLSGLLEAESLGRGPSPALAIILRLARYAPELVAPHVAPTRMHPATTKAINMAIDGAHRVMYPPA